jgi:hypothetical protein
MKLRVNGIYRLPNDRELVVISEESEDSLTYTLEDLDADHPLRYSVSNEGRLSTDGKLTAWDFGDLQDTDRDALRRRMT